MFNRVKAIAKPDRVCWMTYQVLGFAAFVWLALYLSSPPLVAAPIDEFRISDLEQRIRDLENTTREQSRLINQLLSQNPVNRASDTPTPNIGRIPADERRWLSGTNWSRVQPGMSELQVIELLGPPTQTRVSDDGQTQNLLYAMEIGRSGFLTGKVELQDHKTRRVEIPQLK